jgi:carboxyl-terminal processing protease
MRISTIIGFIFPLLLAACSHSPKPRVSLTDAPSVSSDPVQYLNDALDIMQNNSLNRQKIDWPTFRAAVFSEDGNLKTAADTYPCIEMALSRLNHHSFLMDPQEAAADANGTSAPSSPPKAKLVENRFGYVVVPTYLGFNQDSVNRYATDMQKQIEEIDRQHPCGWIVDLRGNLGGNMWPMLVGIGPILGEGKVGSFVDADGNQTDWHYLNGRGIEGTSADCEVIGKPYHLSQTDAPVAVLFGGDTASSGEDIVIAFVGRKNARSFGSKSDGFTTSNDEFILSDGAMILLTTAVDADRTGKVYGEEIVPDVSVDGDNKHAGPIPEEALRWLGEQAPCR